MALLLRWWLTHDGSGRLLLWLLRRRRRLVRIWRRRGLGWRLRLYFRWLRQWSGCWLNGWRRRSVVPLEPHRAHLFRCSKAVRYIRRPFHIDPPRPGRVWRVAILQIDCDLIRGKECAHVDSDRKSTRLNSSHLRIS